MSGEVRGRFAAVDLGASSGRVIVGEVLGEQGSERVLLTEVHRFANVPVSVTTPSARGGARLHWDVLALHRGVLDGLREATRRFGRLDGIGIDSWAVDFGLLDADGVLLGNPVHYRDPRTDGVPGRAFATVPAADMYETNGLQVQPFNTVFQLLAGADDAQSAVARTMLLVPDLIAYWLTGEVGAEVTNASTTGLLDARRRTWAVDLAGRLGIDTGLLPPLREPGTVIGHLRDEVRDEIGHDAPLPVIAVGSHDTASAVVGVPLASSDAAYVATGTWSLVGLELDQPVLTEASRAANFTNELGVDGTVRYLRNVTGLWLLQECLRTWEAADGAAPDLPALLAGAADLPALATVVDVDDAVFVPPGDMAERIAVVATRTGQPVPGSRAAVVRCVVDSLALGHRRAVRRAGELSGRRVDVVHLVGGGVLNQLLCRMTAEAAGVPVLAGPVESAALGNVLVQARAAGVLDGDLAALRAVGARDAELRRHDPAGPGAVDEAAWQAAESRLDG